MWLVEPSQWAWLGHGEQIGLIHDTHHLYTHFRIDGKKAMSCGIPGGGQMINFAYTCNCGRMFLFSQNESASLVFQNILVFLLQNADVIHLSWFVSSTFSVFSLLLGQIIYRTVQSLRKIYFWIEVAIWNLAWSWLSPSWLCVDGTEKGKGIMLEKWNRFSFINEVDRVYYLTWQ